MGNFEHVMLDLETMGNKSNSVITSIGAVQFNIENGKTGDEFYERVDIQSCLDIGLIVNASTIYWWLEQNETARKEMCKPSDNIKNVLEKLKSWFGNLNEDFYLWGNGARFDIGILEDAYVKLGYYQMPWNFRCERDLRTLAGFAPEVKSRVQTEWTGIEHNPIDDCKLQIKYAVEIWNEIKIQ